MIDNVSNVTVLIFLVALLITLTLFYFSNGKNIKLLLFVFIWACFLSGISYNGFFQNTNAFPPRFTIVIAPSILFIVYGLLKKQRAWIYKNRNIKISTFLHVVRLPVEFVLLHLFIAGYIPELMTFEGWNFDILMGVTAPIMGLLFLINDLNKTHLLIWNIIGLTLISLILFMGIFSASLPFQLFGFDQPNVGINYFPFVLLPGVIVPIVIWTHISDILFIINKKQLRPK